MEPLARSDPNLSSPPPLLFSSTELDAAEQLVQLSGSTSLAPSSSSSCSSTSSWPRPRPAGAEAFLLEAEDEDEEEIVLWRRTKRYRTVADLYAATRPIAGGKRSRR